MKTHWFPLIAGLIKALFRGGGSFGGGTLDSDDTYNSFFGTHQVQKRLNHGEHVTSLKTLR